MKPDSRDKDPCRPSEQSWDTEALEVVARQFAAAAREHARRKLGPRLRQRLDSEDVLQEALLEAARIFLREQTVPLEQKEFLPWIEKVIDHKIGNLARHHGAARRSPRREQRLEPESAAAAAHQLTPSGEVMASEQRETLRRAIDALPSRQREVVMLVHIEKLRLSEAAQRMGKTANATSVLLHKALKRLRQILASSEERSGERA